LSHRSAVQGQIQKTGPEKKTLLKPREQPPEEGEAVTASPFFLRKVQVGGRGRHLLAPSPK
jgi:hypothetical protein